jgi:Putative capsular polysaccharide synthesis protein
MSAEPRSDRGLVDRLRYRYYLLAKAYYHLALLRMQRRDREPPILVYQMGKVGSRTVLTSLREAGLGPRIFHVHVLTPESIEREERLHQATWRRDARASHIWKSQHLRRRLQDHSAETRWNVVTLVRDPVARNVSSFFQIGERALGVDFGANQSDVSVAELTRRFLEDFDGHDTPLTWFDDELGRVFGIDVFARPFPHEQGFDIYEGERARVLLLRLEDLSSSAATAFQRFLGLEKFRLAKTNVAREKDYAPAYERFVEGAELPGEYLDRMYDSRYARHFYSGEDLARFRSRWARAADRAASRA